MSKLTPLNNPVRDALQRCRHHFISAGLFSAVSNLLMLTPSIYMMQVYDRVLPTGGLVSLAAISAICLFALGTLSILDWLRGRLLVRAGALLDHELAGQTLRQVVSRPELSRLQRAEAMRDVDTVRQGISSPAASALLDAPWAPIYILTAFLLHPALGALALVASILMLGLAWHNERSLDKPLRAVGAAASAAYAKQNQISAHAAEVRALGMGSALAARQLAERAVVNTVQAQATFTGGSHSAVIRFFRLALQSGALALGAVLVVEGQVSGGAVFASSLLLSRALQPIDQIVGSWKSIQQWRNAYVNLTEMFVGETPRHHTQLPAPRGALSVERLMVANPSNDRIALAEISFEVAAGDIVGVVGLSGAGKSTLLRTIAGATQPARGHVRFDGASAQDWNSEQLARHIGFLPQNFALFPGTVKENIARFRGVIEDDGTIDAAVIEAANSVGAHEMILRLPEGYDTPIGTGGLGLSAGQSQRIALARALFGKPRILLLDEPTAHLDTVAQHAFMKTLSALRVEGFTVLFATHSSDILASADKVLLLKEGRLERYGSLIEASSAARPVSHVSQKVA